MVDVEASTSIHPDNGARVIDNRDSVLQLRSADPKRGKDVSKLSFLGDS